MQLVSGIIVFFSIVGLLASGLIVLGAINYWFGFCKVLLRAWIERRKRTRGAA